MLLEAAAYMQSNAPSRCSHPRGPSIPDLWKPRSTSSGRAWHPHACCACPSEARKSAGCARKAGRSLGPATPGPLSSDSDSTASDSDSTVPTLRRLQRSGCLSPAQTVPVCRRTPTSHAIARLSSGPSPPSPLHCRCRRCGDCAAAPPCLFDEAFELSAAASTDSPGPALPRN